MVMTKLLKFTGNRLNVNVDARGGGIRVDLVRAGDGPVLIDVRTYR